ncbi:MAG: hypothetical protein PHD95_04505 [Candidatus ainarchaeum sp.]|nr:hypothetical protein [Candidatus ainarchaeum sp.]
MQRKRIFFLLGISVFAIVLGIGFFTLANPSLTGFFGLPKGTESAIAGLPSLENNEKIPEKTGLGAELSISVLKKSLLSAKLFLQGRIPNCPETTDANVIVENRGNEKIEAIKIKTTSQLQIRACSNCTVDTIGIGETKKIQLKLCNASEETPLIIVSSANTEQIEIRVDKSG